MSAQGRLLIVDDELSVRDSLAKWFHEEGYEVTTAENGNDALTCLAESRWDAALVDIKMHGIDGVELQPTHARNRSGTDRHHDDGLRLSRDRGYRSEERSLRLCHQAARSG